MSDYADSYIKRSLRVNRVSAGEAVRVSKTLATAQSRIRAALMRLTDAEFSGPARERAIAKITQILQSSYKEAAEEAEKIAAQMVEKEAEWQISTINEYTTSAVNTILMEDAVRVAQTTPYQGKLFSEWYRDAGVKTPRKVFGIIEAGFINGQSIPEVTRDVEMLAQKAIPDLKTLVRSNLLHASSIARSQVIAANEDLFEGSVWNSTLDVRTTPHICGVRDQKEYDKNKQPVGHSLLWGPGPGQIHFNCRSIEIPKLIGVEIKTKRPAVSAGKEYQRGDKTTNRGTVREPTKANRDKEIFKVQQKASTTNYEDWLRTQKKDFVADALGSMEMAEAFKKGEALDSLTANPLGTPLGINQL